MQMLLLLTLALLPLGAVAIYQTNRVTTEAERTASLALLGVTSRAARNEEMILERAFGAARFFATVVPDFIANPDRCARDLGQFVERNARYSFVGILPLSGQMTCTSTGTSYDFSDWDGFDAAMAAEERTIVVNHAAPLSGESVFVVSEPFQIDGAFGGFISISVPHAGLPTRQGEMGELGLENLITFNSDGAVLTSRSALEDVNLELPADRRLADLVTSTPKAFVTKNVQGERRTYTVVPITGSPATVLGVWRTSDGLASQTAALVRPAVFPVLMWFASMGVAMLSLYMLVLRHLSKLRRAMERFTQDRQLSDDLDIAGMPNELAALSSNYVKMTEDILRHEAELENTLHEKGVLVKEIHHRVKNNLQLISSIMNMQIRAATATETKQAIARLQDRVRSLATIHRDLYQSQNEGMVNAGALVTEIIEKSKELAVARDSDVALEMQISQVLLYPDQAVPLSLLVAEGMTNVMKYIGAPKGGTPWVRVVLRQDAGACHLALSNSVGEVVEMESTGLESELINAFSIQLGSDIIVDRQPDSYTMSITFKVAEFQPETLNY